MSDNLFKILDRELSIKSNNLDSKIKYINTDNIFQDYYSSGNKMSQNYNLDAQNDLTYGIDTRRTNTKNNKSSIINKPLDKNNSEIMNIINTDINLKLNKPSIKTAAKIPKESIEYWDNTKRHNLDTAIYTNNPSKIGGRGFGDIDKYDLFMNGIGVSTRQDNPDIKPQNVDNDRIYLPNHNYNNDKFHVTADLQCGADTRYINKKLI